MSYGDNYISKEEMKELLLYKRVVSIDENTIELDNGIRLEIECTESDCCAGGYGLFKYDGDIPLDAVITDVTVGEMKEVPDDDTYVRENTIRIFHNQNGVIEAWAETDAGNGGFYYSVTSLVIKGIDKTKYFAYVDA